MSSPDGRVGTGASSPVTVEWLTPGRSYTFSVTAVYYSVAGKNTGAKPSCSKVRSVIRLLASGSFRRSCVYDTLFIVRLKTRAIIGLVAQKCSDDALLRARSVSRSASGRNKATVPCRAVRQSVENHLRSGGVAHNCCGRLHHSSTQAWSR